MEKSAKHGLKAAGIFLADLIHHHHMAKIYICEHSSAKLLRHLESIAPFPYCSRHLGSHVSEEFMRYNSTHHSGSECDNRWCQFAILEIFRILIHNCMMWIIK